MGRTENIQIINDTLALCRTNPALASAIETSIAAQTFIPEAAAFPAATPRYEAPAAVVVSKKRSFEAAAAYPGQKVAVLNFASAVSPGGGVIKGSNAQEESLCRISTLYPCLIVPALREVFYDPHFRARDARHNDDCIYTPGVVVFKTDSTAPELLPESDWYAVDVITCAAPNLRLLPGNEMNPEAGASLAGMPADVLHALHVQRLRRILDIAAANGADTVILGAFGCGAFLNDPVVVADAMAQVTQEYRHMFRTIEYAVYCRPSDETNYRVFRDAMAKLEEAGA